MVRVCRPGGIVVMTCACLGRPEHGTTRTTKADAPLISWEYYKNLTARDFRSAMNMDDFFSDFAFFENFDSCDTYFVGFKKDAPPPANTKRALFNLRMHYHMENLRHRKALRRRAKIAIFGEERYFKARAARS
jgi:hypothetical protein